MNDDPDDDPPTPHCISIATDNVAIVVSLPLTQHDKKMFESGQDITFQFGEGEILLTLHVDRLKHFEINPQQ